MSSFKSKKQRLKELLETGALSDCIFEVGGKEIKAHKLILGSSSPVFEKMLYGKMGSDRVVISDIKVEDFKIMLQYIYTEENVMIHSEIQAWNLYYVGCKYLLHDLCKQCTQYVRKNFTLSNLVMNYEYAVMYDCDDLQEECMKMIVHYIRAVFDPISNYHMKENTMKDILEQDDLHVTHDELMKGVLEWALQECKDNSIEVSPLVVIKYLESIDIYKYLLELKIKESDINGIAGTNSVILKCLSIIRNSAQQSNIQVRKSPKWECLISFRHTLKAETRWPVHHPFTSTVSVDRDIFLHGLALLTEDTGFHLDKEFELTTTIEIVDYDGCVMNVTILTSTVSYGSFFQVPLSNTVIFKRDKIYTIRINYVNVRGGGSGAILLYHMNNVHYDPRKKTKITFLRTNYGDSIIKGMCFIPI